MSDSRRRTPRSFSGQSGTPGSSSSLLRVAVQRSAMAADDSGAGQSTSKRTAAPAEAENVSPSPSARVRRNHALAYYEDLVENHTPRTVLGGLPIRAAENPFDGSGRKLSKLALAAAGSKAKTPVPREGANSVRKTTSDSLASLPSWVEEDTTRKSVNERALKRRGKIRQAAEDTSAASPKTLASIASWHEADTTQDADRGQKRRLLKRRKTVTQHAGADDLEDEPESRASVSSWSEAETGASQRQRLLKRRKVHRRQAAEDEVDDGNAADDDDQAHASVSSWQESDAANDEERLLRRRQKLLAKQSEAVGRRTSNSSGSVASSWADHHDTNMTFHPNIESTRLIASNSPMPDDVFRSATKQSTPAKHSTRGISEAILPPTPDVEAQKSRVSVQATPLTGRSQASPHQTQHQRSNSRLQHSSQVEHSRVLPDSTPLTRRSRSSLQQTTPHQTSDTASRRSKSRLEHTPQTESSRPTPDETPGGAGSRVSPAQAAHQSSSHSRSRLQQSAAVENSGELAGSGSTPLASRSRGTPQPTPRETSTGTPVATSRSRSRLQLSSAADRTRSSGADRSERGIAQASAADLSGAPFDDVQVEERMERSLRQTRTPQLGERSTSLQASRTGTPGAAGQSISRAAERSGSLRQTPTLRPRPVTRPDPDLRHLIEQIERDFATSDKVISRALADRNADGTFSKPSSTARATKPRAKRDEAKPIVRRMFTPQDTYFQFQKNSNVRLTARSKPALLEVSDRFCHKMVKYLEKNLRRANRTVLCLADVKQLMRDMGLLPEDDPRNVHLFRACYDLLDYEDRCQVIPFKRLDAIPGSTSVPESIWEDIPKEPIRRRRRAEQ